MYICIEIGGTKLQIAAGDPVTGRIDGLQRFLVDKSAGAAGILRTIESSLSSLSIKPKAICVGFGGPVHHFTGAIANSHQIGGWADFELKKWLETRFRIPAYIDNDANAAALGEARFGAGKNFSHVFYITLGSGVGGGMVISNKLYRGRPPGEAEVGQLKMDRDGRSLESFCSGWALDAVIRSKITQLDAASALRQLCEGQIRGEARFLWPAIQKGDLAAKEIFEQYTDTLAWGLSHVVHLFAPQVIVLGGGVSLIGQPLAAAVAAKLPVYLMKSFLPAPAVVPAALGENAVLSGALCLIPAV